MKKFTKCIALAMLSLMAVSCNDENSTQEPGGSTGSDKVAKYVFYFIGDGMAAPQINLAEAASFDAAFKSESDKQTRSVSVGIGELKLRQMPITGMATTHANNRYITCSAAAATALATGHKTNIDRISVDPADDVTKLKTIAEMAKEKGMKVGIVSSVSIDHATPACFYAHSPSRNKYKEISDQLITSGFEYFGGGSVKWSSRARTLEVDNAEAYRLYKEEAAKKGYQIISSKESFDALTGSKDSAQKVIATLNMLSEEQYSGDGSSLPYTIDLDDVEGEDNKISLADFTRKGIEVLDNDKGFFMMVEGGKIDWACHANDAATAAYEVVAFDEAIGVALEFAKAHPAETLIVVTGDHDCGGLALGFAGTSYESAFDNLSGANVSYNVFAAEAVAMMREGKSFNDLLSLACSKFGFTNKVKGDNTEALSMAMELSDYEVKMLEEGYKKSLLKIGGKELSDKDKYSAAFNGYDPFTTTCTHLLNNKSGVDFASYSHTAVPVMVFASGANSQLFNGYYDNTDIPKKIAEAASL